MVSKFLTDLPVKGAPSNNDIVLIQDIDGASTSVVSLSNLRDYMFNFEVPQLSATNFTATSATFTILDVTQYELSGFSSTGNIYISGDLMITKLIKTDNEGSSQDWYGAFTAVYPNSGRWNSNWSLVNGTSARWESNWTSVNANSGRWNSNWTTTNSNSGRWESSWTTVNDTSARWESNWTSVNSNSGRWESSWTTVNDTSARWESNWTTFNANSSDYESTQTTLNDNSARWESNWTTVSDTSGNWESSWNYVNSLPTTLTTTVCAMSGDGVTPFSLTFSDGLLTGITWL